MRIVAAIARVRNNHRAQSLRPRWRTALEPLPERRPTIGIRLRALVGQLRQAFFVFGIAGLQAVRLTFGGVASGAISLRLPCRLRRMAGAGAEKKGGRNQQPTIHDLPHAQTEASLITRAYRFASRFRSRFVRRRCTMLATRRPSDRHRHQIAMRKINANGTPARPKYTHVR
jgi:hypothetical protein